MDKNHLEQFQGKCSIITSEKTFDRRMAGKDNIGYPPDLNDLKGSMYVSTPEDIDRALIECKGDISKLESSLGFEPGYFCNGPLVRVDINNPENFDLRVATGKEAGANEFWNTKRDSDGNLPTVSYVEGKKEVGSSVWCIDTSSMDPAELSKLNGQYWDEKGIYHPPKPDGYDGKTSGNLAEAVINQVPNTPENITYTKIDGFKRGEDSNLDFSKIADKYSANVEPSQMNSHTAASDTGGGTHAPPSHGDKSDLSDKNTLDKAGKGSSREEPFTAVKPENLAGRENSSKERFSPVMQADIAGKDPQPKGSFSTFTESDLAKRNEIKATRGTDSTVQTPAVSSGLNGSNHTKSAGTVMGV